MMNSSTFFTTLGGNTYLYDANNMCMLNMHPIVELIHFYYQDNNVDSNQGLFDYVLSKYPDTDRCEIQYYLEKYNFIKASGFFNSLEVKQLLSGKVTAQVVEAQLANLDNIVFQVTNDCNFRCKYCCYGELYNRTTHESVTKYMDWDMVKTFFEYIIPYWNSSGNLADEHKIIIGFYGGEPLLNFPLVEKIVNFCKDLESKTKFVFTFSMTTNAMLLNKYAQYLVDNNVKLLISLDGNAKNNQLRVDNNDQPTFQRVFNGIKRLQTEYPEYFEKRVEFNSVLNKHSTTEEIHQFIFSEFGKTTLIEPISIVEQNIDRKNEFDQIVQPFFETLETTKQRREKSSVFKSLGGFFYYNLNNSYKHYSEIMYFSKKKQKKIPTGTCLPFYKKMFILAHGDILACERISMQHTLGKIDQTVQLDFDWIAEKYNHLFETINKQCISCHFADTCSECLFQLRFINKTPVCPKQSGEREYRQYLGTMFSILENQPSFFEEINKTVFA